VTEALSPPHTAPILSQIRQAGSEELVASEAPEAVSYTWRVRPTCAEGSWAVIEE
jgi:hypothetical protein